MGKEVTFIGPTSPVMRVLGDKIGSNLVAQKAGVSTMPWNGDGMTADLDELGNIPFEQARLPRVRCAVCGVRCAVCGVRCAVAACCGGVPTPPICICCICCCGICCCCICCCGMPMACSTCCIF